MEALEARHEITILNWARAWLPSLGSEGDKREARRRAMLKRLDKSMAKSKTGNEIAQPNDLVYDPRYGCEVSRFGMDTGAIRRDMHIDNVTDPADPDGKAKINVRRVHGGLSRLHHDGTIDDNMLAAGCDFQGHFEIAGYCHYTTVDLMAEVRGKHDIADYMTHTLQSRQIVNNYLELLGWPYSQHSKAAYWILGHGLALKKIARKKEIHNLNGASDSRYWRGLLVASLQIMSIHYTKIQQGKKRQEIRHHDYKPELESTVSEDAVKIYC